MNKFDERENFGTYVYDQNLTAAQKEVIAHENGNVVVTASAGSGKTFTMIERVKRLVVENRAKVREILAVTFTEKAAFEMKEKLKEALCKKIIEDGSKALVSQLNAIPTADICTLHSFCGRLIRSYFYLAEVAPDFKIIDEAEAQELRKECIEKAFREFYDAKDEKFLNLVDEYAVGRTDDKLRELVEKAYFFCVSEADPERIMGLCNQYYTENGIKELIAQYKAFLNKRLSVIRRQVSNAAQTFEQLQLKKSFDLAVKMGEDIDCIVNAADLSIVHSFNPYPLRMDFDRKLDGIALEAKGELNECKKKLKKIIEEFSQTLNEISTDSVALESVKAHTDAFSEAVKCFAKTYAAAKKEENVLDFNDLEHFALKVLRDDTVRQDVRAKYKYVFVDEYQDTNGVQEEILSKVSNDNLLIVGDVKQSIYGFRGCRPELFAKKAADPSQKVIRLNDNFRSAKAVVDCVNQIFDYCMTEEYFEEDYKKSSRLLFGGLYPDGCDGRAQVHMLKKDSEKESSIEQPRIYDVLAEAEKPDEQKAFGIASLVTEIINDELGKTYYNLKEKKLKTVTLSDIVILTRSRNAAYVRKLVKGLNAHGIDVVSEVRENVCDFPEIATMINALRLIDCFSLDVPLAATLKSPIGGFSDEQLLEIVSFYKDQNDGIKASFFDAYSYYLEKAETPLKIKLKEFNDYFEKLRFYADFGGAKGVLNKMIEENHVESCLLAQPNGKVKVQRLHRLVSAAENAGKQMTVREFLSKVEGGGAASAFGFYTMGDRDAVTVMTIHASKGLEFPVVITCGLERAMNAEDEREEIYLSRKYGFAAKEYLLSERVKKQTLLRAVVKESMREERVKEEMRLFYVAATRAKYSLHLVFEAKEDLRSNVFAGADKFIDYIPKSLPLIEHGEEQLSFSNLKKGIRRVVIGKSEKLLVEKMKKDFSFEYPYVADTELALKTSVTAASKPIVEEEYRPVVLIEDSTDKEKGNVAHLIMEHFDFSSTSTVLEQAKLMVEKGILTEKELSMVNCERLQNALDSGVFSGFSDKTLYREKAFIVGIEARKALLVDTDEIVLLQGVIDLLALTSDGAEIIDYKYSVKSTDALKERYAKQLELYAYAVEKTLKIPVKKKTLVNLFTGQVIEIR